MFCSDSDYEAGRRRFTDEARNIALIEKKLCHSLMSRHDIQRALRERLEYQRKLALEVETYERLKAGDVTAVPKDPGLGRRLIALRIVLGMSQGELAAALGIAETKVVHHEQHQYRDLSPMMARRIMETLKALEDHALALRDLESLEATVNSFAAGARPGRKAIQR